MKGLGSKGVGDVKDGNVKDRDEVIAAIWVALDEGAAVRVTTTVLDVVKAPVRHAGAGGGAVVDDLPPMPKRPSKKDLALLANASASLLISSPRLSSWVGT